MIVFLSGQLAEIHAVQAIHFHISSITPKMCLVPVINMLGPLVCTYAEILSDAQPRASAENFSGGAISIEPELITKNGRIFEIWRCKRDCVKIQGEAIALPCPPPLADAYARNQDFAKGGEGGLNQKLFFV